MSWKHNGFISLIWKLTKEVATSQEYRDNAILDTSGGQCETVTSLNVGSLNAVLLYLHEYI